MIPDPEKLGRALGRFLAEVLLALVQIALATIGAYLIAHWVGGPQTPIQQSMLGLLCLLCLHLPRGTDKP